jgi:diguanylate cyclase (GGDEF)-like protein
MENKMLLESYKFNIHAGFLFFTAIFVAMIAIFVLSKNLRSSSHRYFFAICVCVFIWLVATGLGYISTTAEQATFWFKIDNFGVVFVSPLFFGLAVYESGKKFTKTIIIGIVISAIFGLLGIFNSYFISESKLFYWGFFPQWKFYNSIPYFIFWFGYSLTAFIILNKARLSSDSALKRTQLTFLMIGFAIIYISSVDYLATIGITVYPFGFISTFIFISIIAYAIVKYRLMDIDLVWRYFLSYALYVLIGLGIFIPIILLINFLVEKPVVGIILASALILAISPPIYKYLIKKIKPTVLGKTYKYWEKLDDLINNSSKGIALKDMISKKISDVEEIMNLKNITLYIYKNSKKMFCPYEKLNDEGKEQPIDATKSIKDNSKFIELLKLSVKPILKEELLKSKSVEQMQILEELENINSNAVFGVFLNNELVGILCLGDKKDGKVFHSEDINKVVNIIYLIENDLSKEMEYKDDIIKIGDKYQHDLITTSKEIINIRDIDELNKIIIDMILKNTNAENGVIYLLNKEAKMYIKKYYSGDKFKNAIESIDEKNYLIRLLSQKPTVVFYEDVKRWAKDMQTKDIEEALTTMEQIGCKVIVSIILGGVLGFICLGEKRNGELYDATDINTLDLIGYSSAMCIQNILFSMDMVIDPVTKINNRKYCDEQIIRSINQTLRSKEKLSCIMIDIDHFKDYNDKYGHQYGDVVLRKVGEYLKNMIRPNDYVCRYGGEEFIVVLPLTKLQGAKVIAERIRKGIKTKVELKEDITISLGVSTLTTNISYKENNAQDIVKIKKEFIERADKALYQAKNEGRNRVCVSEEMKLEEEE